MNASESVILTREVNASVVPSGHQVQLLQGETANITQSLGGSYTVVVNGNLFRIEGKDADALGKTTEANTTTAKASTIEEVERQSWEQMKTCYDPEIPVNVVDLGLVYDCHVTEPRVGSFKVEAKMTLTAPGCGMGPMITQDVQNKLLCIEGVDEANVELVWEPAWGREMMTEAARLQLGLM